MTYNEYGRVMTLSDGQKLSDQQIACGAAPGVDITVNGRRMRAIHDRLAECFIVARGAKISVLEVLLCDGEKFTIRETLEEGGGFKKLFVRKLEAP